MILQRMLLLLRMIRKNLVISTLFLTMIAGAAAAQEGGTVTGTLTDADTGEPLIGANVFLVNSYQGASTGIDGTFSFEAATGYYTLRATYAGYATQEIRISVSEGQTTTIDIELAESVTEFGETVVVIGSRSERTAIETPVPVDVIDEVTIRESPQLELNQVLRDQSPSFNASYQTISDGTDHVNPASLRGLGPDQVLVLVNGKKRHTSALVHVNGTFGRGTVGVDLNAIPKSAIARVEVLRDGASAQYGSDAIAGVVNVVLKEDANKIQINGGFGAHNVPGNGDLTPGFSDEIDGKTQWFNANYGLEIGEGGFFNISADYLNKGRTNRSNPWQGNIFTPNGDGLAGNGQPAVITLLDGTVIRVNDDETELIQRGLQRADFSMKTGQGEATSGSFHYNTEVPLSDNANFYSFGGLTFRNGAASGFYRLPSQEERVDYNITPNGFLPEIHTKINDQSIALGVKGIQDGWVIDASANMGQNSFLFNIENSLNASFGPSSTRTFDAGRQKIRLGTGNIDVLKSLDTIGSLKSLNLAFGGEFRVENYQLEAGEEASYSNGGKMTEFILIDADSTGRVKNSGSQVFPGFQPSNEIDRFRNSLGLYAALESDITDNFLVDIAGRFEDYSDFGSTINGKIAFRYATPGGFALRGAASTGFRAPNLQQLWFNNVSVQFVQTDAGLQPSRVLTAANQDPVTKAFGVPELKEETSVNFSGGITWRPNGQLSLTADGYFIDIKDRIVLSSRFDANDSQIGDEVAGILKPFEEQGVNAAQFWANAVDTETRGIDVVLSYGKPVGMGNLLMTLAGSWTETTVKQINVPQTLAEKFSFENQAQVASTLFNREEQNRLEDALPATNGAFSVRYTLPLVSFLGRVNYFGEVQYKPTNPANDETFAAKMLLDLDIGFQIMNGLRLHVGANNILNTFPDKHVKAANINNGRFVYSRRVTQFGMNGGFYYSRFAWEL